MEYTIENQELKLTVTEWGAQVKSLIRKCDGVEHIWQADPKVWGYHAPIVFPWCSKLKDGVTEARGQLCHSTAQHGFARTSNHHLLRCDDNEIVLELTESEETLALFPWKFRLLSTFRLENDTLHHTLTVENTDTEPFSFGIGYHPAFTMPFDDQHSFSDYELRFSQPESPICAVYNKGLLTNRCYHLDSNITTIPVTEGMFDNDSHCMLNLGSKTLGLYEKNSGRAVVCSLEGFNYCLIWSKPGIPPFICIEPWNSLSGYEDGGIQWEDRPAAATVAPGESWSTTLSTSFIR